MRRYLILLLVLLLPAQSVLAITASYCGHEQGGVPHLGHHQHQHVDQAPGTSDDGPLGDHWDCASHHMGVAAVLSYMPKAVTVEVGKANISFIPHLASSALAQRPERPKWPAAV